MSTRAYIRIVKDGEKTVNFHHQCDGYPSGVGSYLVELLKQYTGVWTPTELGDFINEKEDSFRFVEIEPSWDHEYLYMIDCDKKKLSAYYKGITREAENQENYFATDELLIPDNIFDGRKPYIQINCDDTYRKELAKNILCTIISGGYSRGRIEEQTKLAVEYADELIKQLQ